DDRHHVWKLVLEGRHGGVVNDREGADGSSAGQAHPVVLPRVARWAKPLRWPAEPTAARATLRPQLVVVARLPKGRGVVVGHWDGFRSLRHRLPPPQQHAAAA